MAACASCGHELTPGARFCFNCGLALPDGSTAPRTLEAGATAAAVATTPATAPVTLPAFSPNKGRTVLVYVSLALLALVMLLFIPLITEQIDQLKQVEDFEAGRSSLSNAVILLTEVEENDEQIETMNVLLALAIVGSSVASLFWVHRAYKNLVALNAGNLPSTPAFAVWSFFIPVANLWLGYQRFREIWQASGPEGVDSRSTGASWRGVSVPNVLPLFWAAFIVASLGRYVLQASKPGDDERDALQKLQDYDAAMAFVLVVSILVTFLAAYVVWQISKRQQRAYALMTAPQSEPEVALPAV